MVTTHRISPTAGRRRREREERKQAILAAARARFLADGIAATTMDGIARACDLAKGTLYLYFRSKQDIAFALLIEATDDLLSVLREALEASGSSAQRLERLGVAYHRFFVSQPDAFQYMFLVPHESYSGQVADELLERWAGSGRAAIGLVAGLLEQGTADGEFEIADPWAAAVALWSAITGVIVIPSQDVRRPFIGSVDGERLVVDTVRWLLEGMRRSNGGNGRGEVRERD